jgi:AcrR family transcriptional regulator
MSAPSSPHAPVTAVPDDEPRNLGSDPAKRRQIVEGARAVFLERGFEGASMGEIARVAGVSKGTLYVYFQNKEELFCAIMDAERRVHLTVLQTLDTERPLQVVLTEFGETLVRFLVDPAKIAAMRTAMGIAERLPHVGRAFYERGPSTTIRTLAGYLDTKVAAGEIVVPDTALAAAQFMDMCQSTLLRPALFGCETPPAVLPERIRTVVAAAVDMFLRAYAVPRA